MNRLNEFDIAKGLGIFLVVFGHVSRNPDINKVIYAFHIPLFFFISGFFFNEKKYQNFKQFIVENIKTLILPYATFYVLSYLFWFLIERHIRPDSGSVSVITPIIGLFYGTHTGDYMIPNTPLWFLTCLFVTRTMLFFITKLTDKKIAIVLILVISAVVGVYFSKLFTIKLPFGINSSFMALFFLGSGFLIKSRYLLFKDLSNIYKLMIAVAAVVIGGIALEINTPADMKDCDYGILPLFIIAAYSGIVFIIAISSLIGKSKLLEYFGINSLIIFGLHDPIKRSVIGAFSIISHYTIDVIRTSAVLSLACTVTVLILVVPAIYIFKRYFYFLIGLKKAGKY